MAINLSSEKSCSLHSLDLGLYHTVNSMINQAHRKKASYCFLLKIIYLFIFIFF